LIIERSGKRIFCYLTVKRDPDEIGKTWMKAKSAASKSPAEELSTSTTPQRPLLNWNSTYIADAVAHLRSIRELVPDELLAHTSPVG
jgi:hypothetical protein